MQNKTSFLKFPVAEVRVKYQCYRCENRGMAADLVRKNEFSFKRLLKLSNPITKAYVCAKCGNKEVEYFYNYCLSSTK